MATRKTSQQDKRAALEASFKKHGTRLLPARPQVSHVLIPPPKKP